MTEQTAPVRNTIKPQHDSIGKWLKGYLTFKISDKSTKEINLAPRWLGLLILAGGNVSRLRGRGSAFDLLFDFFGGLIFLTIVWYGIDRMRGKTQI